MKTIEIKLSSAYQVAKKIKQEHGKDSETYSAAELFLINWAELVKKYSDGINNEQVTEDNSSKFDEEADGLASEFLNDYIKNM